MIDNNTKGFVLDSNGKVTGVQLNIHTIENAILKVTGLSLVNEYDSGGNTVTYTDYPKGHGYRPVLLTNYQGNGHQFDNQYEANSDEVVTMNGYSPPNLGPLAIAIVDKNGNRISDIPGGFGLPLGHHVSYRVKFEFKTNEDETPDVPTVPDKPDVPNTGNEMVKADIEELLSGIGTAVSQIKFLVRQL